MEYIPYRKDEVVPGTRFYEYFPRNGYIVARVDIRGTGGVGRRERRRVRRCRSSWTAYDAIEWLADQPWCDGHVNLMGISYGGFTALQVATHQPPHLTSIIPMYFTDDRYTDDCHYRGGLPAQVLRRRPVRHFMIAYNALPPYPEWSGGDWAAIWEEHLERNEPYLLKWLAHQTDGPYWRHGSVRDIADRIECPVFMIGGWRDGYPNPPLRLYEALRAPKKVLVGPWNHAVPDVGVPGPRIDWLREVVRWRDHWCKGRPHGDHGRASGRALRAALREARRRTAWRPRANGGPRVTGRRRARASARSTWTPADFSVTRSVTTARTTSSTSRRSG